MTDAAGREQRYAVELPDGIALAAALGMAVEVHAGHHGGGPNVIGTLLVTDDRGAPLVAINRPPAIR